MVSRKLVIGGEGLRSQPAALLVRVACQYPCRIGIEYMEKRINAKSMMGVFSLGVGAGECVTVTAEGEREAEAIDDIAALINSGFAGAEEFD